MTHPKTHGRELALQYLYMHDLLKGKELQPLSDYLGVQTPPPEAEAASFSRLLVNNVVEHREELDADIIAVATNWKLSRMAVVDRNILRLGLAEMLACPETSYKVIINEAVELARRFSSESSCSFVNGLLDKLRLKHRGPDAGEAVVDAAAEATAEKTEAETSKAPQVPPPTA